MWVHSRSTPGTTFESRVHSRREEPKVFTARVRASLMRREPAMGREELLFGGVPFFVTGVVRRIRPRVRRREINVWIFSTSR